MARIIGIKELEKVKDARQDLACAKLALIQFSGQNNFFDLDSKDRKKIAKDLEMLQRAVSEANRRVKYFIKDYFSWVTYKEVD